MSAHFARGRYDSNAHGDEPWLAAERAPTPAHDEDDMDYADFAISNMKAEFAESDWDGRFWIVAVTGPAGHTRYLTVQGDESDDIKQACLYADKERADMVLMAYEDYLSKTRQSAVCSLVDPEAEG